MNLGAMLYSPRFSEDLWRCQSFENIAATRVTGKDFNDRSQPFMSSADRVPIEPDAPSAATDVPAGGAARPEPARSLLTGYQVGDYRLLERLGAASWRPSTGR